VSDRVIHPLAHATRLALQLPAEKTVNKSAPPFVQFNRADCSRVSGGVARAGLPLSLEWLVSPDDGSSVVGSETTELTAFLCNPGRRL
jgi:hypothetical protein